MKYYGGKKPQQYYKKWKLQEFYSDGWARISIV